MKRVACAFFAFLLLVSMSAGAAAEGAESTREADISALTSMLAPAVEGNLYLKVSSITFSVVGESDDIYLGTIPRELLTWESENPDIIDVEGGVLTAKGVGTTTVRVTYRDRQASCTAGCLAETQGALEKLDSAVLAAPKRLPPEVDLDAPCTYFDDSAIFGDSIAYFLWQYESVNDYLGGMKFVTRQGVSLHSLVNHFKNMYYQGQDMKIEDIVASVDASRIYFMVGCLDFQVPGSNELLMEHWEKLCNLIEKSAPEKEIVFVSNIPRYTPYTIPIHFNQDVAKITPQLKQLAADRGYGFLDLGYYIQDHLGRMPEIYSKDDFHMNDAGNLVWVKLLRLSALLEQEGGSFT